MNFSKLKKHKMPITIAAQYESGEVFFYEYNWEVSPNGKYIMELLKESEDAGSIWAALTYLGHSKKDALSFAKHYLPILKKYFADILGEDGNVVNLIDDIVCIKPAKNLISLGEGGGKSQIYE